ncbi:MAG: AtpZ/AtpI family protein [Lachnospiraceae bacterium]|nr:AtpZ/AtpI family protein [Lachnospiraceae bacterium]
MKNAKEMITLKELSLLVWLTQLGLSVAFPLIGFIWVSIWIRQTLELGIWVIFVGIFIGMYCAIHGFVQSMKILNEMHNKNKKKDAPSVFFNDHN